LDSTRFLAVITWFLLPRRARPAHRPVAKV
jgi:hypothetical protein